MESIHFDARIDWAPWQLRVCVSTTGQRQRGARQVNIVQSTSRPERGLCAVFARGAISGRTVMRGDRTVRWAVFAPYLTECRIEREAYLLSASVTRCRPLRGL